MNDSMDRLLSDYEQGRISRRNFLAAMTAMTALASTRLNAQSDAGSSLEVSSINHVTVFVKDIPKAAAFYQDVFGLTVKSQQSNGINLATGNGGQFLGLFGGTEDTTPEIHHVCLGIKDFDVNRAVQVLAERGIQAQIRMRDDVPELYFRDPNGIYMQLQDESYCGGSGPLGNNCEA